MYQVATAIEFVAPFLYNRPDDERGPGGKKTEAQYESEARLRVHRSADSVLAIPSWTLKVALTQGCKKTFKGKQSITDVVEAMVYPEDALFNVSDADFLHVCWGRVPPRTGALVKIYRPAMNSGRSTEVKFNVVDDRVDAQKLRMGWEQAGLIVGLGSWRPHFGRFIVRAWEVSKATETGKKKK